MIPMKNVLSIAYACFGQAIDASCEAKIEAFKTRFDTACRAAPEDIDCNVFIFHVVMAPENQVLKYPDLNLDLGKHDYDYIIGKSLSNTIRLFKNIRIVFVSNDPNFNIPESENIIRVNLDINAAHPLYERVYAMAAYVRSRMFDRQTVFLDSDTFIGLNPSRVFTKDFDIGVTLRVNPQIMPFNEGVIFANPSRLGLVKAFFNSYVATYEKLIQDKFFAEYYGDIKRWRGGQLSLNTIVHTFLDKKKSAKMALKPRVAEFPADVFNFSFEGNVVYNKAQLDSKFIFHLKGNRKNMVDALLGYLDKKTAAPAVLSSD